jgi:hypothetical protein
VLLVYVLNGSRHKYEAIPEFDDPLTPHVCVVILEATSEAIPEFDDPLTPHVCGYISVYAGRARVESLLARCCVQAILDGAIGSAPGC